MFNLRYRRRLVIAMPVCKIRRLRGGVILRLAWSASDARANLSSRYRPDVKIDMRVDLHRRAAGADHARQRDDQGGRGGLLRRGLRKALRRLRTTEGNPQIALTTLRACSAVRLDRLWPCDKINAGTSSTSIQRPGAEGFVRGEGRPPSRPCSVDGGLGRGRARSGQDHQRRWRSRGGNPGGRTDHSQRAGTATRYLTLVGGWSGNSTVIPIPMDLFEG